MAFLEIFKTIPSAKNYMVSNFGSIYSKKRVLYHICKNKKIKGVYGGKMLKPVKAKIGYYMISINSDVGWKTFYIHRLVAEAFLGESKLEVNHKDGNKLNNHIDNLEYVTSSQNTRHAYNTLLIKKRFNRQQVLEMIEMRNSGMLYREIADKLGCDRHVASDYINGKRKPLE